MDETPDTDHDTENGQDDSQEDGGFDAGAAAEKLTNAPDEETIDEIEQERERRLAPENRPENTEVDNTDATLPTVEAFNADQEETAIGTSDPSETFKENPLSEEEIKEIEEERTRRLADENRPEGSTVDNSGKPLPDDE